jgi:hypothetical protein
MFSRFVMASALAMAVSRERAAVSRRRDRPRSTGSAKSRRAWAVHKRRRLRGGSPPCMSSTVEILGGRYAVTVKRAARDGQARGTDCGGETPGHFTANELPPAVQRLLCFEIRVAVGRAGRRSAGIHRPGQPGGVLKGGQPVEERRTRPGAVGVWLLAEHSPTGGEMRLVGCLSEFKQWVLEACLPLPGFRSC